MSIMHAPKRGAYATEGRCCYSSGIPIAILRCQHTYHVPRLHALSPRLPSYAEAFAGSSSKRIASICHVAVPSAPEPAPKGESMAIQDSANAPGAKSFAQTRSVPQPGDCRDCFLCRVVETPGQSEAA